MKNAREYAQAALTSLGYRRDGLSWTSPCGSLTIKLPKVFERSLFRPNGDTVEDWKLLTDHSTAFSLYQFGQFIVEGGYEPDSRAEAQRIYNDIHRFLRLGRFNPQSVNW